MEIPELNLSKIGLLSKNEPLEVDYNKCGQSLRAALSSAGFLYIENHGIDQNLIDKAMRVSKEFFILPREVKESLSSDPKLDISYIGPGDEVINQEVHEIKEAINLIKKPSNFKPNPNDESVEFVLTELAIDTKNLANRILKCLAFALDLDDKDFFVKRHSCMESDQHISKLR